MNVLQTDALNVALNGHEIIRHLDLVVPPGEVVGLVGPNGCGKSTILRAIYRAVKPTSGAILLDSADLLRMPMRDSAREVSALTQEFVTGLDFTVREIVLMSRTPHLGATQRAAPEDLRICQRAMRELGVDHLQHRGMQTLSGGERQRALIARAIAQEPRLLVLDEPTNHLDLAHQLHLLSMLRRTDRAVLVVLHDLNLAAAACDRIHLVRDGALVAGGAPDEVLTGELICEVFGVEVAVVRHPLTGHPQILYSINEETT